MVKEIINYKCEICGMQFKDKDMAQDCESTGIKELLPVGTIFSMGYEGIVFAVVVQYPNHYRHHHSYRTWACRDTGAGDNCAGENYCGMESWDMIYPPDKTLPAYQRIVKALKDANITPIDYK
jgi:hypothetical protein